jgi:hypothetical protein
MLVPPIQPITPTLRVYRKPRMLAITWRSCSTLTR